MSNTKDNQNPPTEDKEKKGLFSWFRRKPKTDTPEEPTENLASEETLKASIEEDSTPPSAVEPKKIDNPIEPLTSDEVHTTYLAEPIVTQEETALEIPETENIKTATSEIKADEQQIEERNSPSIEPLERDTPTTNKTETETETETENNDVTTPEKKGFFARLKQGLAKTSASLGEGIASIFLGKKEIDDELLEEIETLLLTSDVGFDATNTIIESLTKKIQRNQLADSGALYQALKQELVDMLKPVEQPLAISNEHKPFVILVVGVNGAGKTTTIGKLTKKLQLDGKKVMLAAGDTFRAAAVEQLQVWGDRNGIPVVAQHTGADSASVIFDAVQSAKSKGIDVLIADTAGRLHNKENLMEELKKVRRVITKIDESAPHETLLVLDAGTGQNALSQAKLFNQAVPLSGIALTKLDGTAKGGVIFALANQMQLPIRYIGVGEGIDDLRPFEAESFVQAIFKD